MKALTALLLSVNFTGICHSVALGARGDIAYPVQFAVAALAGPRPPGRLLTRPIVTTMSLAPKLARIGLPPRKVNTYFAGTPWLRAARSSATLMTYPG